MKLDEQIAVLDAPDRSTLLIHMLRLGERLGFGSVSASVVVDRPDGFSDFSPVSDVPLPASLERFSSDPRVFRRDPVLQHCKHSSLPIWWDRQTYFRADCSENWEVRAHHGYSSGLMFAIHMPRGLHFVVGLSNDNEVLPNEARRWRVAADAHLFASFAQQAAFRLLLPPLQKSKKDFGLSPMELEALRWTMEGKTTWEIGRILSKSERSIAAYLANAACKLDCIDKYQAVVKAMRLGLIQ